MAGHAAAALDVYAVHPAHPPGFIDTADPGDVLLALPGVDHPVVGPHSPTMVGLSDDVSIGTEPFNPFSAPAIGLHGPGSGFVRLVRRRAGRARRSLHPHVGRRLRRRWALGRHGADPTDVDRGLGSLLLGNGVAALWTSSLPAGETGLKLVLPWTDLIGESVAFQAWDAQAALGVPVLVPIVA